MIISLPHEQLGLRNRIVMAPMTRYSCRADGLPTKDVGLYYTRRAQNGVGLIIVESAAVNAKDSLAYKNGLQFHSKEHCRAWKPIVSEIQSYGAKVWLQLFHPGRLTVPEITGGQTLSASSLAAHPNPSHWQPEKEGRIVHFQTNTVFQNPEAMDHGQINVLAKQFAASCALAQEAGFDGVEIHGAHGYLLHQFVSTATNQRNDEFCAQNFEFSKIVVDRCRKIVGSEYPISYRLSVHMVDEKFMRYDPEIIDFQRFVGSLEECGVTVFHSSEISTTHSVFGGDKPFHEILSQATKRPLIVCGGISTSDTANKLLEKKGVELVAFGRPFITNPDLVNLLNNKNEQKVIRFDYNRHMQELS